MRIGLHCGSRISGACALTLCLSLLASPAGAAVALRFSPPDTTISLNDASHLSVWVDEAVPIRTFEVFVRYNADVLTSTSGIHGRVFSNAGAYIFEGWQETSPGAWHGYAIVMDALHWAVGPGQLYVWSFTTDRGGFCPVTVDSVVLYAPDASMIAGVTLADTSVRVFDPATSSVGSPWTASTPVLLSPNPFNAGAVLTLDAAVEGPVRVDVFDCRGYRLATVWPDVPVGQPLRVSWDGRDRSGQPAASGVYLFRLAGPRGDCGFARGTMLK